jgi:translation initiation factor IF-1
MAQEEAIAALAKVLETLPIGMFWVELEDTQHQMPAHICGRLRKHFIPILAGDRVLIEPTVPSQSRTNDLSLPVSLPT